MPVSLWACSCDSMNRGRRQLKSRGLCPPEKSSVSTREHLLVFCSKYFTATMVASVTGWSAACSSFRSPSRRLMRLLVSLPMLNVRPREPGLGCGGESGSGERATRDLEGSVKERGQKRTLVWRPRAGKPGAVAAWDRMRERGRRRKRSGEKEMESKFRGEGGREEEDGRFSVCRREQKSKSRATDCRSSTRGGVRRCRGLPVLC